MDWAKLLQAVRNWDTYAQADPVNSVRRVRQSAYHLQIVKHSGFRFIPMRFLLANVKGVPFEDSIGVDIEHHLAALADLGLARIGEGSPFFDELWDRYKGYCHSLGQGPANYIGDNPHTGRVFWSVPV